MSDILYKLYTHNRVIQYLLNITVFWLFLAIDQWLNAVSGGSPGETISGRLTRQDGAVANWIQDWLDRLDKDHCKEWEVKRSHLFEVFSWW
tara:strand:- start:3054 stop:3326 length:273 start_codon:yes stop_codon:yes gene_type:complete